ncbi:hypothetical protein [Variovorax paradoxus]|uniref:Uncharacterized protein n=1 Tax=Variovorax paradoxus TaxID=34073 RepID=A0A679J9A8_VARPD|nr:hypothetical protein VVAX_04370 [Variovorax paradoxus]
MANIGITERISRELDALHAARSISMRTPAEKLQRNVDKTTGRLIAALRMVLPLVDVDGHAWQSQEVRAAIAEGEAKLLAGDELSLEVVS